MNASMISVEAIWKGRMEFIVVIQIPEMENHQFTC